MRTTPLHDMHCHLAFMPNGEAVAEDARANGSLLFANTVTPSEYHAARGRFAGFDNVVVGFGMHPWWVDDGGNGSDVESALDECDPTFIGEVGLDFANSHVTTRDAQAAVFQSIARWAGKRGGKVLSIHSVRAASAVLDILEDSGTLATCTCIFHWYSGPSDQLKRAIDAGCLFSVGPRMTATRKGREYLKAIPVSRMLLETDEPAKRGQQCSFDELYARLGEAAYDVIAVKGDDALIAIDENTRLVFMR